MTPPHPLPWWKLHPPTISALVFVVAGCTWAQLGKQIEVNTFIFGTDIITYESGWPFTSALSWDRFDTTNAQRALILHTELPYRLGLIADVTLIVLLASATGYIVERRAHSAKGYFQFQLSSLFMFTLLVAGLLTAWLHWSVISEWWLEEFGRPHRYFAETLPPWYCLATYLVGLLALFASLCDVAATLGKTLARAWRSLADEPRTKSGPPDHCTL